MNIEIPGVELERACYCNYGSEWVTKGTNKNHVQIVCRVCKGNGMAPTDTGHTLIAFLYKYYGLTLLDKPLES